jgi:hypothetical protein
MEALWSVVAVAVLASLLLVPMVVFYGLTAATSVPLVVVGALAMVPGVLMGGVALLVMTR